MQGLVEAGGGEDTREVVAVDYGDPVGVVLEYVLGACLRGAPSGTWARMPRVWSATPAAAGAASTGLMIGSAGSTESAILAELYAKAMSNAGFHTPVKTLADRELYEPALEKGQIDVVPEYAATLAEFLNTKVNGQHAGPVASSDVTATVTALGEIAEPRGLKVLSAGKAVDRNAFAVSREFAGQHHLKTLSDLGAAKLKIGLAAGDECPDRPYCVPGLKDARRHKTGEVADQ